ncbi:hypothetical protein LAZ67_14000581 [Cordylochernes scorpioides]|uniref:DUF5641 domain-containing protein n=1 Tax=Cordylochernes scorpioides TaxID=51811 RepID=A0ABY6L994_9ARAC|nr:hypothetical protein LAZ67_14000581 [Cordylochernes scorpioides]
MVDVNATKCKLEYANNDSMKMSDIFLQQLEDEDLNDEVENCIDKCIRLKCELDLRHNGQETSEKGLQYLKGQLRGEALRLVNAFPITADNYVEVWQTLLTRYDNPKDLIFTQIDNALRLQKLADDNHKSMFKLLDSCNEIVRTVKVLGYQIDSLSDVFLVKIIQDKLDKTTRKQWELQNNPRVVPSIKDLMEFLEIHAKSLQNLPNKDANVEESSIKRETAPRMEVQQKQWGHPGRSPMDYSSKRRPCRICLNRGHAGRFHPENRRQLKVGDVVLIGQENLKRMFWPKGRIVNLIPGKDGIVRVAHVKTSTGTLIRALQRLHPLEISSNVKTIQMDNSNTEPQSDAFLGNRPNIESRDSRNRYGRVIRKPASCEPQDKGRSMPGRKSQVDVWNVFGCSASPVRAMWRHLLFLVRSSGPGGADAPEKYPTSSVLWTERRLRSILQAASCGRKGRLGVSHKQSLVDGKDVLEYPTSRVSWTERTSWSIPQAESRGRKGRLGVSLKRQLEDGKDALDIARAATRGSQASDGAATRGTV